MNQLFNRKLGSQFGTLNRQTKLVKADETLPQVKEVLDRLMDNMGAA